MTEELRSFLEAFPDCAVVEVASTQGSTPRESGASMLVSQTATCGTIGGGQLEFIAIAKARRMLVERSDAFTLDVPLGPEIGQCCGGRVEVFVQRVDREIARALRAQAQKEDAQLPQILMFGGGHVGHALAKALALLPARTTVIETRADALTGMPPNVRTSLVAMPEQMVREAAPGAAFVVLTHDHALDFLIVAEALKRGDAAYVGMIGSETKRATFRNWFMKTAGGTAAQFAELVSPIGGRSVKDKRPAVIAALAAAEIIGALVSCRVEPTDASGRASAMS